MCFAIVIIWHCPFCSFPFLLLSFKSTTRKSGISLALEKRKKKKNIRLEKFVDCFTGSRNAIKLAASGGNSAAAVAASAHPPVLWSSRRKPGKSFHPFDTCSRRFPANMICVKMYLDERFCLFDSLTVCIPARDKSALRF